MNWVEILITAMVNGAGVSIGSYFATRLLVKNVEKVMGDGKLTKR